MPAAGVAWFVTAATPSPPLLPPLIISLPLAAYRSVCRYSQAASTSSNTFCLLNRQPASCHGSPYSPPPRALTNASTPRYDATQVIIDGENIGVSGMLNPP